MNAAGEFRRSIRTCFRAFRVTLYSRVEVALHAHVSAGPEAFGSVRRWSQSRPEIKAAKRHPDVSGVSLEVGDAEAFFGGCLGCGAASASGHLFNSSSTAARLAASAHSEAAPVGDDVCATVLEAGQFTGAQR